MRRKVKSCGDLERESEIERAFAFASAFVRV